MKKKIVRILGISVSHCATACLLEDGYIVGSVSEERLNRIKNYSGYPILSINYLLKHSGISGSEIDLVVLSSLTPIAIEPKPTDRKYLEMYDKIAMFLYKFPLLRYLYNPIMRLVVRPVYQWRWRNLLISKIQRHLQIDRKKIICVDHHLAHVYAPIFGLLEKRDRVKKYLVFSNDGMGDSYCASVNIFNKGRLSLIGKKTPNNFSLAIFYSAVTRLLGMKPLEHEYKVMGLAPYCDNIGRKKVYELFKDIFRIEEDLSFYSKIIAPDHYPWLKDHISTYRFDWIAGAVQLLTEDLLSNWIEMSIEKTGIKKVLLCGGIFMNIKANMVIGRQPKVKEVIVMPSASDESTALGAAFCGYETYCNTHGILFDPKPVADLYLGPEYTDEDVENCLRKNRGSWNFNVRKILNIELLVAKLLANGEIVARFNGRMEWGARALGNRSILANPTDADTIRVINEQIKQRDFWMPFSPVILEEKVNEYLINPKNINAPYMTFGFNVTRKGKESLKAGLHPYDFTCRPQILGKDSNESYYSIIKEFEKITGIGALLNTSFNLHGEPIVCSPDDAFHTFKESGLRYLAIGNFLVSKR